MEINEIPLKNTKYFFAVPKNDDLKKIHKTNLSLIKEKNPREQFRMGIDPKEIICKNDLYLALKTSNLPVCLSLETLVELRHRDFIIAEVINYDKIGYTRSENQFLDILKEKDITYDKENLLLISGWSQTSLPPTTGYCGYVLDTKNEDWWFSSTYHFDTLKNFELVDENPDPCKPASYSCECSLQTLLAEKNLKKLSFFDNASELQVGKIFTNYLNEGGKITNVPNSFVIGKYDLDLGLDIIPFCGQFQGKSYWYFQGSINGTSVIDFSLNTGEKPKLCAINQNPQVFTFDESAIVKDSFIGQ